MPKQQLQQLITELHAELEKADRVDDSTRAALASVTDDIQRVLAEEGAAPKDQDESLADRVQETLQEFGAEHPQLARVINQMAAALANLGI